MTLRDATPADIPALAHLISALGYPTTPDQMAQRFANTHAHPDYRTVLAETDAGIVGLIGLCRQTTWEYDGSLVRVMALIVSPLARRQGVGEGLIGAAEAWAVSIGARSLLLTCGNKPNRAAAHQFYPRMGFVARSTGYRKEIIIGY